MHGWTILYGIINFAILAAALYFIGRKMVANMISGRREKIVQELQSAEDAKVRAAELREDLKGSATSKTRRAAAQSS